MRPSVYIVVEGERDKYFLDSYIHHLAANPTRTPEIKSIGGKDKLGSHCNEISKKLYDGKKVLIVFDANSDYEERKSEIEETLRTNVRKKTIGKNLPPDIFLFPNNRSSGALENLLEEIVIPEHKKIFDCFDNYKICLKEKDNSYRLPDVKGKIHCYMEASGILEEKNRKNHFKPEYWNFESPSLDSLRDFLLENINTV